MWSRNRKKSMREAQRLEDAEPGSVGSSKSNQSQGGSQPGQTRSGSREPGQSKSGGEQVPSSSRHKTGQQLSRSVSQSVPSRSGGQSSSSQGQSKPASAGVSSQAQKAPALGIFAGQKEVKSSSSGIPGLDVQPEREQEDSVRSEMMKVKGQAPSEVQGQVAESSAAQPQPALAQLVQLLQEGKSASEVAKSLNMTLDEQTLQLMNNLSTQLLLAAQMTKTQKPEEMLTLPTQTQAPASHSVVSQSQMAPGDHYSGSYPMAGAPASGYGNGNFSGGDGYGGSKGGAGVMPQGYQGDPHGGEDSQSSVLSQDSGSNAGVKAALAQLLTQQGMRVSMGGSEYNTTEMDAGYGDGGSGSDRLYTTAPGHEYHSQGNYQGGYERGAEKNYPYSDDSMRGGYRGMDDQHYSRDSYDGGGSRMASSSRDSYEGGGSRMTASSDYYGQYGGQRPRSYADPSQPPARPKSILKNKSSSGGSGGIPSLLDTPTRPPSNYQGRGGSFHGGRGGWN